MKLLVAGGAGFIGSNFVKRQVASNKWQQITVVDALTYAGSTQNIEKELKSEGVFFEKIDICAKEPTLEALKGIDVVINFAAESHVDRSIADSHQFLRTNVLGAEVLLNASLKSNVTKFIQVSTDEVYGSISSGSWSESEPIQPNSPYAASKAGGDLIALAYHRTHGLNVIVTRSSNNYGPYQFPEKIIPLFVTNLIEGKKIPIYGDGQNVRDWLHVNDHCRALEMVISGGQPGNIYNIGGGTELSNLELSKLILNEMHEDNSSIEFISDRKGHDKRYSVNFNKIATELGYKAQYEFENGIKETIKWYVNNQNWWKERKYAKK